MIKLEQKAEILMKYFREGISQRKIAKEMKVSRTTIKKYIDDYVLKLNEIESSTAASDMGDKETMKLIEELVSVPKYDASRRKRIKLTDKIIERINELIKINEKNKSMGRHKQLMKKTDMHEKLIEEGFDISYTTVCNYIRENFEKREVFIRQEYTLGETLEFDWGEVKLTIAGKLVVLQMGLMTTACGSLSILKLD